MRSGVVSGGGCPRAVALLWLLLPAGAAAWMPATHGRIAADALEQLPAPLRDALRPKLEELKKGSVYPDVAGRMRSFVVELALEANGELAAIDARGPSTPRFREAVDRAYSRCVNAAADLWYALLTRVPIDEHVAHKPGTGRQLKKVQMPGLRTPEACAGFAGE